MSSSAEGYRQPNHDEYAGKAEYSLRPDATDQPHIYALRAFGVHIAARRVGYRRPGQIVTEARLTMVPDERTGTLTGIVHRLPYTDGVNAAICARREIQRQKWVPEHDVPDPRICSCGIYGYGLPDHPDAQPPRQEFAGWLSVYVQGVIEAGGRVLVGDRGIRCQYARITALCSPLFVGDDSMHRDWLAYYGEGLVRHIRRRYPSAAWCSSREEMLSEFPLTRLPQAAGDEGAAA